MKVVFLDVDGVLNSERFLRTLEDRHRQLGHLEPPSPKRETTCDCFKLFRQIDDEAVKRLNGLVAITGAKIVISSSWRKLFDPPELARILGEHGLIAEIIGETPDGETPEALAAFGHPDCVFRGNEIDLWLRTHPEVTAFVILDDGGDMAMHQDRLVQTDAEEGLLDEHVDLAVELFRQRPRISLAEANVLHTERLGSLCLRRPSPHRENRYRWDEIGSYVVSTVRLPFAWEEELGARYETLVYSLFAGAWDHDGDGVHTKTMEAADAAHEAACTRVRERRQ